MSIKEAIERTTPPTSLSGKDLDNAFEEKHRIEDDYKKEVLEAGIEIFRESGVTGMLDELRDIINAEPGKQDATVVNVNTSFPSDRERDIEHPREKVRYEMYSSGTVTTGIGWDYDDDRAGRTEHPTHNGFFVEAQPLTGALVVTGHIAAELIPKSTWQGPEGRKVVEDAIARAYKKPARWSRPVRIG